MKMWKGWNRMRELRFWIVNGMLWKFGVCVCDVRVGCF